MALITITSLQVIETKSTINNLSSTKPSDDSQERKLTIMIIVIVGVFFLCNIPGYSLSEAFIIAPIKPKYDNRLFKELKVW